MPKAISNTSPLLYLYRVGVLDWLPKLFDEVWLSEEIYHRILVLAGEESIKEDAG